MTPEERDRLTKVEVKVDTIEGTLDEVRDDVKALRSLAESAKGGYRALIMAGGIGSAVGAAVAKFVPLLGKTP